ncbi:hypothetical protein HMPREF0980_00128 [Dorea sp. D27]|nr:hypothetical protein HMPREF0980_00128 [Dorea sp. D27]
MGAIIPYFPSTTKKRRMLMKHVARQWRLLASGLFLMLIFRALPGLEEAEARAASVSLVQGEAVYYQGYSTHYYYIDGVLGYCLEPGKTPPSDGSYDSQVIDNSELLSKAMYYVYGGPGYETHMKPALPEAWRSEANVYCLSHCVLSYVYDNLSGDSDAFIGLNEEMKNQVIQCAAWIRAWPAIPAPDISFSGTEFKSWFDREGKQQRTDEITCIGDADNSITIPLPEGVWLVNATKGTKKSGKVQVMGGDRFYLSADAGTLNGERYESGALYGSRRQAWRTLVIRPGSNGQNIGGGSLITVETAPASLAVTWLPRPELDTDKQADKTGKSYKLGDIVTYTIEVTQRIQGAVAKNVVISDTILTEGVKLQKNSVVLLDAQQRAVSDAMITVEGNTYTIRSGESLEFLQSVERGEKFFVEYQIAITDASVIGREIENEVIVRADNADEVRDREIVKVEEPETPKEPEEPEEVPKEEEPEIEEPEEEPAPKPAVKAEAVKTGDEENLMVLILLLILSCTAITACGKIARKTK